MSEAKTRFSNVLKTARNLPAEPVHDEAAPPPPALEARRKVGRPPGKKSSPLYRQVTVYLREDVHRDARKLLLDEPARRQFSDLVNDLVSQWLKNKLHSKV